MPSTPSLLLIQINLAGESAEVKKKAEQTAGVAGQKANETAADARVKKDELLEKGKTHPGH